METGAGRHFWRPGGGWGRWTTLGVALVRGPLPQHIIQASRASTELCRNQGLHCSILSELSSELGSMGPVHVELGCLGWQRDDRRLGPGTTHIWEAPPQHQREPFHLQGPQRAEEKGGVTVTRAARVYSLSSPLGDISPFSHTEDKVYASVCVCVCVCVCVVAQ